MKDQYVGDINDFLKYAVLRSIQAVHRASLFVCWMLTDDDLGTDGRKLSYLSDPATYRGRDPELFDTMRQLVLNGPRSTRAIEQANVLPRASFFRCKLDDGLRNRETFLAQMWERARGHEVVFFDPDNGLSVASVPAGRAGSRRYIDCQELTPALKIGASVILYQHFPRVARESYVFVQLSRLAAALPGYSTLAVHSPHVAFLAAAREGDSAWFATAFQLVAARWGGALTLVEGET
jgi:hypothetical protein